MAPHLPRVTWLTRHPGSDAHTGPGVTRLTWAPGLTRSHELPCTERHGIPATPSTVFSAVTINSTASIETHTPGQGHQPHRKSKVSCPCAFTRLLLRALKHLQVPRACDSSVSVKGDSKRKSCNPHLLATARQPRLQEGRPHRQAISHPHPLPALLPTRQQTPLSGPQ